MGQDETNPVVEALGAQMGELLVALSIVVLYVKPFWMGTYRSESIPLRSTLGIHMIYIVVPHATTQWLDFMLKDLSNESWGFGHIGRETVHSLTYIPIKSSRRPEGGTKKDILQSNHLTSLNLRSCSFHPGRGEEVQPANLKHIPVRSYLI
jgi:hypothetical protein